MSFSPSIFVPLPFPFGMERMLYIFLPDGVFLPCYHGLYFDISSLCENSNNQKYSSFSFSKLDLVAFSQVLQ